MKFLLIRIIFIDFADSNLIMVHPVCLIIFTVIYIVLHFSIDYTDSQNENFFFLHEQIFNFLKGHDLLVTNRPQKNFPRV